MQLIAIAQFPVVYVASFACCCSK